MSSCDAIAERSRGNAFIALITNVNFYAAISLLIIYTEHAE